MTPPEDLAKAVQRACIASIAAETAAEIMGLIRVAAEIRAARVSLETAVDLLQRDEAGKP